MRRSKCIMRLILKIEIGLVVNIKFYLKKSLFREEMSRRSGSK